MWQQLRIQLEANDCMAVAALLGACFVVTHLVSEVVTCVVSGFNWGVPAPVHLTKSDAQETIAEEESIQTPKKQISSRGIMSLLKNTNPLMSLK